MSKTKKKHRSSINNKLIKTNKNTKKIHGGKVVGSGGYGCLLIPAIKCKNEEYNRSNSKNKNITKLMLSKNAQKEYNEIMKYKKWLETIPNYKDYFLIDDIELCEPTELSKSDLQDYETKCKALNKKKITKKNINKKLNSVMAINMPNGGKDLDDFIKQCLIYDEYKSINNSLLNLLTHAIIPMNNLHIYHSDIKAGNILMDYFYQCKIIDWGLSTSYANYNSNDSFPISRGHFNRPIQFNIPFSVIILNNDFKDGYEEYLTSKLKTTDNIYYSDVRAFILQHFVHINKEYKTGHIRYINKIMRILFNENIEPLYKKIKNDIVTAEYTYYYIIEYISKIVYKYTDVKNKKLDLQEYFKKVFLKSIDIWGFVFSYFPILNIMSYTKRDKLSKIDIKICEKIKFIIIHYLYENPLEPINHVDIKRELLELNELFDDAKRENSDSLRIILERYMRKINNEKNSDDTTSNSDKSGNRNKSNTETAKFIQFFSSSYSKK
uniref:Protein kinase domain-containing protein n=1 Tax=viral metagenome TaxID=1070528 RepID=A0A6C0EFP0_9ZZZZ